MLLRTIAAATVCLSATFAFGDDDPNPCSYAPVAMGDSIRVVGFESSLEQVAAMAAAEIGAITGFNALATLDREPSSPDRLMFWVNGAYSQTNWMIGETAFGLEDVRPVQYTYTAFDYRVVDSESGQVCEALPVQKTGLKLEAIGMGSYASIADCKTRLQMAKDLARTVGRFPFFARCVTARAAENSQSPTYGIIVHYLTQDANE